MIPSTRDRVPQHTSDALNRRIAAQTAEAVRWHAGHPEEIATRLHQLDREWDIERTLEANAATLSLAGTVLGATVDKRWFAVPAVVAAFLLQHAVQGWCPPLPILRRLGFRTANEIDDERYALKALRGDFGQVKPVTNHGGSDAMRAVEAARP